jgi:hypothetical protein
VSKIYELFKKRRQIRWAWDQERIPSKELIHSLIETTFDVAPSKQNLFPFKIHIIGPNNNKDIHTVGKICALFKNGSVNQWQMEEAPHPNHKAPWVLIFELRKCEPNNFVVRHGEKYKDGEKRFTQLDERFRGPTNTKLACVEVGMFLKVLASQCLENDLQISYIRSFPEWNWIRFSDDRKDEYRKDTNKGSGIDWSALPYIKEMPIMVAQIGYKANIEDILATNIDNLESWAVRGAETKPPLEDIIEYHLKETDE